MQNKYIQIASKCLDTELFHAHIDIRFEHGELHRVRF